MAAMYDEQTSTVADHLARGMWDGTCLVNAGNRRGDVVCKGCDEPWDRGTVLDWPSPDVDRSVILGPQRDDPCGPHTLIVGLSACPCCDDD